MSPNIAPKPDWRNFFCPECHNVRRLPYGNDDTAPPPWCIHHGGEYSWHKPHRGNESGWTPMVFMEEVYVDRQKLVAEIAEALDKFDPSVGALSDADAIGISEDFSPEDAARFVRERFA